MSEIKSFHLPDLGEGLPDAEIVEWHVAVGDVVRLDAPLVSMETAKAVVDVPSPFSGKVLKLAGQAGDVVLTGAVLVEIELDPNLPQRADAQDTGHHHGAPAAPAAPAPPPAAVEPEAADEDAGTVVGAMESSNAVRSEQAVAIGGIKAMPAVRALAKKLKVDLARVRATGADGVITLADVKAAAASPSAQAPVSVAAAPAPAVARAPSAPAPAFMPPPAGDDKDEPIRGVRRNMLRSMSAAHAEVVPTTLMDDADLSAWAPGEDITVRTLRALAVAAKTEPAMNAWLNAKEGTLRRHSAVHIGVAIDSADGLFVASLKHCDTRDGTQLRAELNRLRDGVRNRTLPPEDLSGYTLMFSNFGVFAGKYATPVVVPPCVCIVGAGRLYHAVVPVLGGMETHRMMPISLTFDHRAATGGEAARFLKAMIDDLQRAR
ncbi:dihydrolipoamide acetyltransferase component of pyruvate dehydrogenase complex [Arenimonas maotaiensis]|uniref:Dihydrolipoamide acetyltransferase component of pyruvate dehydrogenase complex n=1 Tax=Arenimonas maotaiensis TaxID=1446479 RepID=A0A917CIP9_9GAMM|nr:dihydrolipoamide acetyltransferase family protein [Arenimonas maotaiensis]GGF87768.1 dihydrolipoamide acetyltransferase component of pyruvate dehydrogenase complex [Arenimonas maotaiensis]